MRNYKCMVHKSCEEHAKAKLNRKVIGGNLSRRIMKLIENLKEAKRWPNDK